MRNILLVYLLFTCIGGYSQVADALPGTVKQAFNQAPLHNSSFTLQTNTVEPEPCRNGLVVTGNILAFSGLAVAGYGIAPIVFDKGANTTFLLAGAVVSGTGLLLIISGKNACKKKSIPYRVGVLQNAPTQLCVTTTGNTVGLQLRF